MSLLPPINSGKGPSNSQTQIATSQQDFMNTLQQDFGKAFAGQQNIINALTKSMTSTLTAGPSQFGFSAPETTALNTLATTQGAQQYANARQAAAQAAPASGASNAQLPTNAAAPTEAALAQEAAINQSNALLGIQEAGYRQGTQNYNEAVSGLTSAASLEQPSGLASVANTAGEQAYGSATQNQKQLLAANPWPAIGGLAGSLAGAALNMAVPGAGSALSGILKQGQSNAAGMSTSLGTISDNSIPYQPIQSLGNLPTTPIPYEPR